MLWHTVCAAWNVLFPSRALKRTVAHFSGHFKQTHGSLQFMGHSLVRLHVCWLTFKIIRTVWFTLTLFLSPSCTRGFTDNVKLQLVSCHPPLRLLWQYYCKLYFIYYCIFAFRNTTKDIFKSNFLFHTYNHFEVFCKFGGEVSILQGIKLRGFHDYIPISHMTTYPNQHGHHRAASHLRNYILYIYIYVLNYCIVLYIWIIYTYTHVYLSGIQDNNRSQHADTSRD